MAKVKIQKKEKSKKEGTSELGKFGVTNYRVGDFLIRLKNAALARRKNVEAPASKFVKKVADVLEKEGYIENISQKGNTLSLDIVYRKKEPVLTDIRLVSKPGFRLYMSVEEMEKKKGPSILIISTPKGIMTSKEAIKKRVGGEVIAEIL